MIRYGYACKTIGVPGTAQRSLTLAHASPERLLEVSRHNLGALGAMVRYCRAQGIALLRISSDVIPLASHASIRFNWRELCGQELADLGRCIRDAGVRVSMHPGQYTVLNSPRADVVERAVADLVFHADFLDALGVDQSARIVLHVGGVYDDRAAALARFVARFKELPEQVRRRLALENDERSFGIGDVLDLCRALGIPAIFDVFHHSLTPSPGASAEEWLDRAAATWNASTGRQKIHYSQQLDGGKPGMHSRSIGLDPFLAFHAWLGTRDLDVMLEVKDKNLSALQCTHCATPNLPRRRITEAWARYKYAVLEHSPALYSAIREYCKADSPQAEGFYRLLEQALAEPVTPGHAVNAAEHVWGYLDTLAEPAEKKRIRKDLAALRLSLAPLPGIKKRLLALAEKQQSAYLIQSLYCYDF